MSSAAVDSAEESKKSPLLILRLETRKALQALDPSGGYHSARLIKLA